MLEHLHLVARDNTATDAFFSDLTPFTGTTTILTDTDATSTLAGSIVATTEFPSQSLTSIVTDSTNTDTTQYNSDLTTSHVSNTRAFSQSVVIGTFSAASNKESGASAKVHHGGNGALLACALLAVGVVLQSL